MSQMAAGLIRTPVQSPPTQVSGVLQRKCDNCRKKKPVLQRAARGPVPETVPPIVHEVLRSPGQPPDREPREFMEPRFGHDFSRVRLQQSPGNRGVARINPSGLLHSLLTPLQSVNTLTHHSPEVLSHPATMSVSGFDTSKNSTEIGALAGTERAYGWTQFQLHVNVVGRPRAMQQNGNSWNVFCPRFDIFFDVDNTIYITNEFPEDGCLYRSTLHHEVGHAFDEYGIVVRQEELLAADLGTLPGPDNPDVVQGADAAQQRLQALEEQARDFRDCALSQACYDISRRGFARDSREYPTAYSECPAPRPPVPSVADPAHLSVTCTSPPAACPRPVIPFP